MCLLGGKQASGRESACVTTDTMGQEDLDSNPIGLRRLRYGVHFVVSCLCLCELKHTLLFLVRCAVRLLTLEVEDKYRVSEPA